jgi:hypothetical protein
MKGAIQRNSKIDELSREVMNLKLDALTKTTKDIEQMIEGMANKNLLS